MKELLHEHGIHPATEKVDRRPLVRRILTSLNLTGDDPLLVGRVSSVCLVVHHLLQGQSMHGYEDLHKFMRQIGSMPEGTRCSSYDSGWRVAAIADAVVIERLRRRMQQSKYLAFSIDDSADTSSQEQCCIIVYRLHKGRRESHLLKFHELPGALSSGSDIERCASRLF